MLDADAYGNFVPGPHGLPQYVTTTGLVEGNLASPVPVPANGLHIETAFLNDIAHSASPVALSVTPRAARAATPASRARAAPTPTSRPASPATPGVPGWRHARYLLRR